MKVQHAAILHEKAVQAVARGEVHLPRERRSKGHSGALTRNVRVNPSLMAYVRRVTKGDMSRVRIISETQVLVVNTGKEQQDGSEDQRHVG